MAFGHHFGIFSPTWKGRWVMIEVIHSCRMAFVVGPCLSLRFYLTRDSIESDLSRSPPVDCRCRFRGRTNTRIFIYFFVALCPGVVKTQFILIAQLYLGWQGARGRNFFMRARLSVLITWNSDFSSFFPRKRLPRIFHRKFPTQKLNKHGRNFFTFSETLGIFHNSQQFFFS